MNRFLVTGGSGFIGTNLVEALLKDGLSVLNLDRTQPMNQEHFPHWKQVDILDRELLKREITAFDPEVIVHLAAVTDLNGRDLDYYSANIQGTQNIIDIAATLPSLKRVLYTSSMYVCKPGYIPKDFSDYHPHTAYGESKVKGEHLVKAITGVPYEWIIVRPTSIWGPWFGVPYIDFFNVVYHSRYFDFGGTCTKSYGFIDNAVFQIRKLSETSGLHGQTFYLGDTPPIQITEWADEISVAMGKGHIRRIPYFAIQLAAWAGDLLGFLGIKFPMTSFRLSNMTTNNILPLDNLYEVVGTPPVGRLDGVNKTLAWLRDHKGYAFKR